MALAAATIKDIQQTRKGIAELLADTKGILSHFPSSHAGSTPTGSQLSHAESTGVVRPQRAAARGALMPQWLQQQSVGLQTVEVINPMTKRWELAELVKAHPTGAHDVSQ